jgi:multisubunit Na+/H+ antiporter MnhB subunit
MKGFLRRLRGVIGMGLTWGLALAGVGTLVGLIFGGTFVPGLALTGGFLGFIVGSAFAVILSVAERRQSLGDLSLSRMALWGGIGGALVAGATNLFAGSGGLIWEFVASVAVFGALASTGTVALARRADTQLIEGEDESSQRLEGDREPLPALEE